MTTTETQPTPPAKRPYVAPALVIHGDVQALTLNGKTGSESDADNGGSFSPIPDAGV